MEDSANGGIALRRKFTGWMIKVGIRIPEVALKAAIMHFQSRAETTSTLVGFCTLGLVALALSDAMAEASNTTLLEMNLPDLKKGLNKADARGPKSNDAELSDCTLMALDYLEQADRCKIDKKS